MLFNGYSGLCLALFVSISYQHSIDRRSGQVILLGGDPTVDHIATDIREHWMGIAVQALFDLVSPCPFNAYGTAIVNHTAPGLGELVCIGANAAIQEGNPSLHGEIAAIRNCTAVLTDPNGPYALSSGEALVAWRHLSLYTTAEACPMCASAISWSGFKEYIYATSIDHLIDMGWKQIRIPSHEVIERSDMFETRPAVIGGVLTNETNPLLGWQYRSEKACPKGCTRDGDTGDCTPL